MAYINNLRAKVGHIPLIMTSASGALVNDHRQVLLQERADTGNWGFPGGYMEFGESFEETVKREFKEDPGLEIHPVKILGILDHDEYTYPNGDQVQPVNVLYQVRLVSSRHFPTKPSETKRLRYFDMNDAPHFFNHQHEKMWTLVIKELKRNQ